MTPDQTLMAIAASITAITVIAIGIKKTLIFVKKTVNFFDEWIGTEDTPGVVKRLEQIEVDLRSVHKEVTYNSGTSLKDAVRRIEEYQGENHKRIVSIEDYLTRK